MVMKETVLSIELNDEQYKEILDIMKLCKIANHFKYDNLLVLDEMVSVVKEYVVSKSDLNFRDWLIENKNVLENG